jgi:hypothetical protein
MQPFVLPIILGAPRVMVIGAFAELRDPEDVAGEPTQNAILIEAGNVYNSIHEPILA